MQRRAADLVFLKTRRDNNALPRSASVNHRMKNMWNSHAFDRLGLALVCGEIRRVRSTLDSISHNALMLHLQTKYALIYGILWTPILC
jgi:hypothetical protein